MRILLTGSTGLVGRNFLEHPDVESFDVLAPPRSELNLLDYNSVQDCIACSRPDMVIHAAGRVGGIQANIREPVRFFLDNLDMGRNVIWSARQAGVKRLINLGSSCMYPRYAPNPLKEEAILCGELEPTNEGYALAKIAVARLCEYITREDPKYQYKTLIPCNLYGRWDNFDPTHSHLIPAIIHKVHQAKQTGQGEVEIWGEGNARREFMCASDLADCLVQSVRRFDSLPPLMNVGLGADFTINEYYKAVAEVVGYTGSFVHDLSKPVGMDQKVVSIDRLSRGGWVPKMSLYEGLIATFEFYRQRYGRDGTPDASRRYL
jgi:GDP-L-fucose synthase